VAELLGFSGGAVALAWLGAVGVAVVVVLLRGLAAPPADLELTGPPAIVHARPATFKLRVHASARTPSRLAVTPAWPAALAATPATVELTLRPGQVGEATFTVLPGVRGRHEVGPVEVWALDPLRLLATRSLWPGPRQVEVHPATAARGGRRARRLRGRGAHAVRRTGAGTDFAALRPYVPGDDTRAIHWPTTARLGRPVVRRFAEEHAQQVIIAVDCSRRMAAGDGPLHTRLDRAVEAAISLAAVASDREDRVGAVAFSHRVHRAALPGRAGTDSVARLLFDLQPDTHEPDYAELFRTLRDQLRRRTLLVLLTDPQDAGSGPGRLELALPLVRDKHLVVCAAVGEQALRGLAGLGPTAEPLTTAEQLHGRAAALDLLGRRAHSLARLRAAGAVVLDADAGELQQALLGGYSAVKSMGAL
jgi:uncharacterized protein (DUF58 family)